MLTCALVMLLASPSSLVAQSTVHDPLCVDRLRDAVTGSCDVQVSRAPVLGMLYPLGPEFYVGPTARVGIGTTDPAAGLHVAGNDGLLVEGTYHADWAGAFPASGPGTRLMWYPQEAAFRAGTVDGDEWDEHNVGEYSIAMGYNSIASGDTTVALGYENVASGRYSLALGYGSTASGRYSVAIGLANQAQAIYSLALGFSTLASGRNSTALGEVSVASGQSSTALGHHVTASGNNSIALGVNTRAEGQSSAALGRFNIGGGSPTLWVATDPLFEIGNGTTPFDRRNALTVLKNGNTGIGTSTPKSLLEVNGSAAKPGGGAWSVASDRRLKKDVRPLERALETLLALRGVSFEYRDPAAIHELPGRHTGFVAQEVEPVIPDWVEDVDGTLRLTIRGFEALAVEAVRELRAESEERSASHAEEIAALRATCAEGEARIAALEDELRRLSTLVERAATAGARADR